MLFSSTTVLLCALPAAQVFGQLLAGFLASEASPYVVGVNLVGQENGAVALRDYWLHMHMVR